MWDVLVVLLLGFAVGFFGLLKGRGIEINGKLQNVWLLLLVFLMGMGIGRDKEIIGNLPTLGGKAAVYAICAVGGSMILAYFVSKLLLERGEKK